jgi:hypothetical protein
MPYLVGPNHDMISKGVTFFSKIKNESFDFVQIS